MLASISSLHLYFIILTLYTVVVDSINRHVIQRVEHVFGIISFHAK